MTPAAILSQVASEDAAEAFVEYRKGMGKRYALTARAAKSIAKSLETIRASGGDPDAALDLAQEHGWMTIKPDWYFKQTTQDLRVINGGGRKNDYGKPDAQLDAIAIAARSRRT